MTTEPSDELHQTATGDRTQPNAEASQTRTNARGLAIALLAGSITVGRLVLKAYIKALKIGAAVMVGAATGNPALGYALGRRAARPNEDPVLTPDEIAMVESGKQSRSERPENGHEEYHQDPFDSNRGGF